MNSETLKLRTKNFAHRCVKMAMSLPKTDLFTHIKRQLIRSATSVAANYRASCLAQSKAAFISKLSIALEEVDETAFWIEFSIDEDIISESKVSDLLKEAHELTAIFSRSRLTAQASKKLKTA